MSTEITTVSREEMQAEWERNNTIQNSRFNMLKIDQNVYMPNTDPKAPPVINPMFGRMFKYTYDTGEEIVTPVDMVNDRFVPIRWRWHSKQAFKPADPSTPKVYCKEVEQFASEIQVFNADTKELIETGKHSDLKEKYDLKLNTIVYFAHKESIYKLTLPAGSWENNQAFERELKSKKTPHCVQFTTEQAQSGSNIFAKLNYIIAEPVDIAAVYPYIQTLKDVLGPIPERNFKQHEPATRALPEAAAPAIAAPTPEPEVDINNIQIGEPTDDLPF